SRGVAVEAYEQLVAEGWLVSRRGAGTHVAERSASRDERRRQTVPPIGVREDVGTPRFDLRTGRPDLSTFPRSAWAAAVTRALRTLPDAALGYGDPRGLPVLRETLA